MLELNSPSNESVEDFRARVARSVGPAINGVIFHKCTGPELQALGPILSLIWIPLKAGVDFDDAQCHTRLWQAALDYISQLPGCERILAGHCLEQDVEKPAVLLLVRWRDAFAWREFQQSPGFLILHIARLIREIPINYTVHLPAEEDNLLVAGRHAEVTLVALPSTAADDFTAGVTEDVKHRHRLTVELGSTGSIFQRLEPYAARNPRSQPAHERASTLPSKFVAIALWEGVDDYLAATTSSAVAEADKIIASKTSVVIKLVAKLRLFSPPANPGGELAETPRDFSASNMSDLMMMPLSRRGLHAMGKPRDQSSHASQMCDVNEDHRLHVPRGPLPGRRNGSLTLRLLEFRIQLVSSSDTFSATNVTAEIPDLRGDLNGLKGCKSVVFGPVQNVGDAWDLLLFWYENAVLSEAYQKAMALITEYFASKPNLRVEKRVIMDAQRPTLDAKIAFRDSREGKSRTGVVEIISFYVLEKDKQMFSPAYSMFPWGIKSGYELACAGNTSLPPMHHWARGAWEEELIVRDEQQLARFNSVVKWHDAESIPGWYQELAERIRGGGYERWGLGLDVMRLITSDVEVRRILLDKNVENTYYKMQEVRRRQAALR